MISYHSDEYRIVSYCIVEMTRCVYTPGSPRCRRNAWTSWIYGSSRPRSESQNHHGNQWRNHGGVVAAPETSNMGKREGSKKLNLGTSCNVIHMDNKDFAAEKKTALFMFICAEKKID